jgi:hypothetical protein
MILQQNHKKALGESILNINVLESTKDDKSFELNRNKYFPELIF